MKTLFPAKLTDFPLLVQNVKSWNNRETVQLTPEFRLPYIKFCFSPLMLCLSTFIFFIVSSDKKLVRM